MANPYSGVNTYHATTILPSDGDPAVAESVNSALRDLTDDAVYLNTQLGHQAFDDRGKTSTITGNIVLNDGGGSVDFEVPVTIGAQVDVNSQILIHTSGELISFGDVDFKNDVTLGSTGTDQVSVYGKLDVYGETVFHENVAITTGDDLTVHGNSTLDGETVILGQPGGDVVIDSEAFVNEGLTVQGAFSANGDVRLGNNASDSTNIRGPATLDSTLDVDDDARVNGSLTVDDGAEISNGLDVHGTAQLFSHLTVNGDTTIGSNSSDTVTFNAVLAGGLAMGANGRVLPSSGSLSGSQTIGLATSRVIAVLGGSSAITLTIDDTGMTEGDAFLIFYSQGTASLTVEVSGTAISKTVSANSVFMCNRFPGASANNWSIVSMARTN